MPDPGKIMPDPGKIMPDPGKIMPDPGKIIIIIIHFYFNTMIFKTLPLMGSCIHSTHISYYILYSIHTTLKSPVGFY